MGRLWAQEDGAHDAGLAGAGPGEVQQPWQLDKAGIALVRMAIKRMG